MRLPLLTAVGALSYMGIAQGFSVITSKRTRCEKTKLTTMPNSEGAEMTRRKAIQAGILATGSLLSSVKKATAGFFGFFEDEEEETVWHPAFRPNAYFVDATCPPNLIGLGNVRKELEALQRIGKGKGTRKEAITGNTLNLNNMLNKAGFGLYDLITIELLDSNPDRRRKRGFGWASFVFLGFPAAHEQQDVDLSIDLLNYIFEPRKSMQQKTALGLWFAPLSTQSALDAYAQDGDFSALSEALIGRGVPEETVKYYSPVIQFARGPVKLDLLALSPEFEDIRAVRAGGLQNVNPQRRSQYVADAEGFINLTQERGFQLYTKRSLLKDFVPIDDADQEANFFAERILVHETAATVAAKYGAANEESLVAAVAPMPDVRYMQGMNGRIPRISKFLLGKDNRVGNDAITTILINPTPADTLTAGRRWRLEINTGPDTVKYQAKVGDYLWLSQMPKVSIIPRLVNVWK